MHVPDILPSRTRPKTAPPPHRGTADRSPLAPPSSSAARGQVWSPLAPRVTLGGAEGGGRSAQADSDAVGASGDPSHLGWPARAAWSWPQNPPRSALSLFSRARAHHFCEVRGETRAPDQRSADQIGAPQSMAALIAGSSGPVEVVVGPLGKYSSDLWLRSLPAPDAPPRRRSERCDRTSQDEQADGSFLDPRSVLFDTLDISVIESFLCSLLAMSCRNGIGIRRQRHPLLRTPSSLHPKHELHRYPILDSMNKQSSHQTRHNNSSTWHTV